MAQPVLERDLQDFKDLEVAAKSGCAASASALFYRLNLVCKERTKWQWVIHGDTTEYRQRCVRWLVRQGRYTTARRFALCGRGDVGLIGDDGFSVRIKPKGCGCRFCPRCSRRYGRRYLSRVIDHLSSGSHGALWHLVLTQRVQPDESLEVARERFSRSWKVFYRKLDALGMVSGLATYHVTASTLGGWHFHCHLLAEFDTRASDDSLYAELDEAWFAALRDLETKRKALFTRIVCQPGGAMESLAGEKQMEFWRESRNPAETCLQYVLRDVLQGVEGWIEKMTRSEQAEQFAAALSHAKLHRLYGRWRRAVEPSAPLRVDAAKVDAPASSVPGAVPGCGILWSVVGGMDEVLWWAKTGREEGMEVVRRLRAKSSNRGAVALRLCRLVAEFAM